MDGITVQREVLAKLSSYMDPCEGGLVDTQRYPTLV